MTNFNRLTLPAFTFALCSSVLFAGSVAHATDPIKPADAMAPSTDAMAPANAMAPAADAMAPANAMAPAADAMAPDPMKADCMEKAGMETDAMKKDEAMKACDAM